MPASPGRQTKIVCTIGPSSRSPDVLCRLIENGMDVARINFSHGNHDQHRELCESVRQCAAEFGKAVGIMVDLQGPKIRTGALRDGEPVYLQSGAKFALTTRSIVGDASAVSTDYEALPDTVEPGNAIFLSDGSIELVVDRVKPTKVHCTVVHGGVLGEHKGINMPGVHVGLPTLTQKDLDDLEFALDLNIDFIALSFVRSARDVRDLRKRIKDSGRNIAIVAKIERQEALREFNKILKAADAIMLARGDLGVEVPLKDVPQIQKDLIAKCNDLGVPIITATQMLESMTQHVRPTRAEVADVANAIYDGTDAVMLSGETASGKYPVQAVRVMAQIAERADAALADKPSHARIVRMRESGIRTGRGAYGDAIAQATCRTAHALGATRIICFTKMASTAALIARYRPHVPVTAITLNEEAQYRCSVIWGVHAVTSIEPIDTDDLDAVVDRIIHRNNLAKPGDTVIIAGGFPLAMRTRTNMLKLHRVKKSV